MARVMRRNSADAGGISVVQPMGRVNRAPKHTWHVRTRPFEITPVMAAPVLPGETMKNMVFQSRCVTDPLANGLIGWWLEHMFFYVKHSQLANAATYMNMHLDPTTDLSAIDYAAINREFFADVGQLKWVEEAYDLVVEHYFRDEEDAASHTLGASPLEIAGVLMDTWMDSLVATTVAEADDITVVNEAGTATVKASDIDAALRQWQLLRLNNLTTMDYEDYLQTFGIRQAAEVTNRPELIRHVREWQYPSNTIDPADGSASAAVSWATQESASKGRFFKEPGLILGIMVARPKVYIEGQSGAAIGSLDDAYSWLPAVMRDDPYTSIKQYAAGLGPLGAGAVDYTWDARDLFLYGDQWLYLNGADPTTATDVNTVGLPSLGSNNNRYPAEADVDAVFSNAVGGFKLVRADGVCSLVIAGTQVDHT